MALSGPRFPGSGTNAATVGTLAWANPGNIVSDNGSAAAATQSTVATGITNYLRASSFGFALPPNGRVEGIIVEIERRRSGTGSAVDSEVKIVKPQVPSPVIGTQNKASGSAWPTSYAYQTYGSSTDLWSETWTPTLINDPDFGAVLSTSITNTLDGVQAEVDGVRITVYYYDPIAHGFFVMANRALQ